MTNLVLADDATGALECASLLAGLGHELVFVLEIPRGRTYLQPFVVVDTESRHLPADVAAARIKGCLAHPHKRVFKKTDSTLRGNIAPELLALPAARVVYVPAYPALGRTVRGGCLYVDGVPVAETAFGRDPRQPVTDSSIAALFPPGTRVSLAATAFDLERLLRAGQPGVLICDGETEAELDAVARVLAAVAPDVPVAGPSGMVARWAGTAPAPASRLPRVERWLVVCGSLHPRAREQAVVAAGQGCTVIASPDEVGRDAAEAARQLAVQVTAALAPGAFDGVLVMGGDTVRAVWRELGITELVPLPPVLPGIPACASPAHGLVFVTKAGGFGDANLVEQVRKRFS